MTDNDVTALRLHLQGAGFHPLPLEGKAPRMPGWQEKFDTSVDEIQLWPKTWHLAHNTGVLAKFTPAVDIDITIEPAAEAVEALARDLFEEHGDIHVRTGLPPKRLIPLRTDEPFNKIMRVFVAPNGTEQKIEILGNGQQYVVDGIHPDTRKPYSWHGGELATIKRADLPYVRREDMEKFLDAAARLLVEEFDFRVVQGGNGAALPHVDDAPQLAPTNATPWSFAEEARLRSALGAIPADEKILAEKFGDSHGTWVKIGRAIERLGWGKPGYAIFRDWSMQNSEKFNERRLRGQWTSFQRTRNDRENPVTIATVFYYAMQFGWNGDRASNDEEASDSITLDDFRAYMPTHSYLFVPTRQMWAASSVNSRIPRQALVGADGKPVLDDNGEPKTISASAWLDRNRPVEQMTWAPGLPMIIESRLISEGGWIEHGGVKCFNLYRPPTIIPGNAVEAGPWLNHIRHVFDGDAEHMLDWLAHRVQRPADKINHALVLGGAQGIGKDTALEPVKRAVGPWNFCEVSPHHMLGRFNGFLKSVILRVSEARDLGDVNRFQFYDHMKAYTAAPPDVLRLDEKHLPEYTVPNCCGIIITTNHKADGIYLPADDRRHFVAWSNLTKDNFDEAYWSSLWGWFASGGDQHVAAYLAERDISKFNPKAPPPKTPAFWDIVDASRAPEDAELADVLDEMGNPDAVTLSQIRAHATGGFLDWLQDRKNRRVIPHRMEGAGYTPVRNDAAVDGQWKIGGTRQTVYAKSTLSIRDRLAAASGLGR